jgi:hypothetical protein
MVVQSAAVQYTAQQLQAVPLDSAGPSGPPGGPAIALSGESAESGAVEAVMAAGGSDKEPGPVGGNVSNGYGRMGLGIKWG